MADGIVLRLRDHLRLGLHDLISETLYALRDRGEEITPEAILDVVEPQILQWLNDMIPEVIVDDEEDILEDEAREDGL